MQKVIIFYCRMVIGADGMVRTTALNTAVRIMAKITAVRILVKNTAVFIIAGEVADVVEGVDAVVAGAVGHGGHREVDRTGRTTITSHDRTGTTPGRNWVHRLTDPEFETEHSFPFL